MVEALGGMNCIAPAVAGKPASFEAVAIEDFVAFVLAGGEVTPHHLKDRVLRAENISFLREGSCLLGVAGLKIPSEHHRREVAAAAEVSLGVKEFAFELGWVFVLPSARGRRLSFPLCAPLVEAAKGKGIFATSRVTNAGMHKTLARLGFSRAGKEWPSQQNEDNLALFVRNAA